MQARFITRIRRARQIPFAAAAIFVVALAGLIINLVVLSNSSSWQLPDYQYRIPVALHRSLETSTKPIVIALVIPRNRLPSGLVHAWITAAAKAKDGTNVPVILGPQGPSPFIAWVLLPTHFPEKSFFLYLRPVSSNPVSNTAPLPRPPFLFSDTFKTDWHSSWTPLAPYLHDEPPGFPNATAQGIRRPLPSDLGAGYTVEVEASDKTGLSGGQAVALTTNSLVVSFARVDQTTWEVHFGGIHNTTRSVSYKTTSGEDVLIRLDIPRKGGKPMRFFLDGQLLATIPLPQPLSGIPDLFLYDPDSSSPPHFSFVSVRPYQQDDPIPSLGQVETNPTQNVHKRL